jgi:P4 family phage/plasmid primase-like protien
MTNIPQVGQMRDSALALAARGWYVHPLKPGGKAPLSQHGQDDATIDPDVIARMWRDTALANIGIAMEPSKLYGIDVDTKPGKVGAASWAKLVAEHGHVDTFTVRTFSGGLHYIYEAPTGIALPSTTSKLGKHVDTRGNGYLVAPGSYHYAEDYTLRDETSADPKALILDDEGKPRWFHVDAGWYEVIDPHKPAPLPEWIAQALARPVRVSWRGGNAFTGGRRFTGSGDATEAEVVARVQILADELRDTPDGTGNDVATRNAFKAGQYAGAGQIRESDAVEIMTQAVAGWSWRKSSDYKTMLNSIERAVAAGTASPRAWEVHSRPPIVPLAPASEPLAPEDQTFSPPQPTASATAAEHEWEAVKTQFATLGFEIDDPRRGDYFSDARQTEQFVRTVLTDPDGQPRYLWSGSLGWLIWDGYVWDDCTDGHITDQVSLWTMRQTERAVSTARKLITDAAPLAASEPGSAKKILQEAVDMGADFVKGWRTRQGLARLEAVAKMSRAKMDLIQPEMFDQNPDIINTRSGIVDLKNGSVRPAQPDDLCRKITSAEYEPGFTHPDWTKTLEAVPADILDWFHRFLGQAITGYANREDQLGLFIGDGQNGKSLIVASVKAAIGKYYASVSDRALMGGNIHPTELMVFFGARLAVLEETEEDGQINMQAVKKIVGTDAGINARHMNKDAMTFSPTHTFVINTNHLPVIKDTGAGAWRRLLAVPFPYTFKPDDEPLETPEDRPGDLGLKVRMTGTEQSKAVLSWLIDGAVKWYASGMMMGRPPERIKAKTEAWQNDSDLIASFFDDGNAYLVPGVFVKTEDLYQSFTAWLEASGNASWSMRTFNSRLENSARLARKVGLTRVNFTKNNIHKLSTPITGNKFSPPATGYFRVWHGISFKPVATLRPELAEADPWGDDEMESGR